MVRKLEVSEETFQKIKNQLNCDDMKELNSYNDMIGEKYFFRTVTYHMVGKVISKMGSFLKLENASWIPDSGRFMQFIQNGELNEVEPVGIQYLNMDTIVDFFPWKFELPKEQK